MKIIKRNGSEETFDVNKIVTAITKANDTVEDSEKMTPLQIGRITDPRCIRMREARPRALRGRSTGFRRGSDYGSRRV